MSQPSTNAQPQPEHFKYPECLKGNDHIGEILNLVCLQPKCLQNSIICGICYDEQHKGHKIRPLKVIISQSRKYLQHLTPMNIDSGKIKTSIEQTRVKLIEKFTTFEQQVLEALGNIKVSINGVFTKVIDQIELKSGSNDELIHALEEIKSREMEYEKFIVLMKKLLTGVPQDFEQKDQVEVTGQEIEKAVVSIQKKVQAELQKKSKAIQQQLESHVKSLQKLADNPPIFKSSQEFIFSQEMKHAGINIVSDKVIKSVEAYKYHFGLLEPALDPVGKTITVAFKINQNSSNWLGVGVCYKNIVQTNNYEFNYSTAGHGAYLISSNGGSWSSTNTAKNNVVTAFSYYTGDIILLTIEPDEMKITFKKKGTEESYVLEYEVIEGDELCLCGLFYYSNDEIQFLGNEDDVVE